MKRKNVMTYVTYETCQRVSQDQVRAAIAVAYILDWMELPVDCIDDETFEEAAMQLGDDWDADAVRKLVGGCFVFIRVPIGTGGTALKSKSKDELLSAFAGCVKAGAGWLGKIAGVEIASRNGAAFKSAQAAINAAHIARLEELEARGVSTLDVFGESAEVALSVRGVDVD